MKSSHKKHNISDCSGLRQEMRYDENFFQIINVLHCIRFYPKVNFF